MTTAKEQLPRDVSHELRSPLTRIKVLLELIEPPERVAEIRSDIRELEVLINSILESARHFHRLDNLKKEEVDQRDVVGVVILRQGQWVDDLVLEKPAQPVIARIERNLFTRVVDNLLVNAPNHGQPAGRPVVVRVTESGGTIELTAADSGPGIRAQVLPHLVEPFYQADTSRSRENAGFGLGLNLCRTIVAAHGGVLILLSRLGQGTQQALVRLPR